MRAGCAIADYRAIPAFVLAAHAGQALARRIFQAFPPRLRTALERRWRPTSRCKRREDVSSSRCGPIRLWEEQAAYVDSRSARSFRTSHQASRSVVRVVAFVRGELSLYASIAKRDSYR